LYQSQEMLAEIGGMDACSLQPAAGAHGEMTALFVAAAYFRTRLSHTLLFWAAFVLTRPLGAVLGDFLDKPVASGGLALSRYGASAVLLFVMVACLTLFRQPPARLDQRA
ncbi:MAG TPA: hypothetical protein PLN91_12960, partial [Rhodanobacteraceae bacterium]|nr:hypothetical protein [Rhodanobacteraceae bacterium]